MANPVVRSHKEGDEDAWLHVMNEGLKACSGYEPSVLNDFLSWKKSRHFDEKGLFFAQLGETVVGTVAAMPLKYPGKKRGRITNLAVLPSHQGKGIGSTLLRAGLNYLKKIGGEEAQAWSWNSPAFLGFYQKHGFEPERKHLAICWDLTKPLPELAVNGKVEVKKATTEDIEVVAELGSKAYLPYWNWWYKEMGLTGAEKARVYWRERVKNELESGYAYFIAYAGEIPVGFSAAQIDKRMIEKKVVKIGTLWAGVAVLPEHRRKRIGSRLLREALTFLKREGMEEAIVGTFSYLDSNAPAVNLYIKSGGVITREYVSLSKLL